MIKKDVFSEEIPEIEFLKKRKKKYQDQIQKIQNLEKFAKCLKNQCIEEKNTEVLHILLIQAR